MQLWEYTSAVIVLVNLDATLNSFGVDGWELVTMFMVVVPAAASGVGRDAGGYTVVFKRLRNT